MKIDNSISPNAAQPAETTEADIRIRRGEPPVVRPESPAVITHLSQNADINATRDIDMARVAEIRQAISEGRLQIRSERIAAGLIASVRELLDDAGT